MHASARTLAFTLTGAALMLVSGTTLAHFDHDMEQPERRAGGDAQPRANQKPMEQVELPAPEVSITIEGEYRVIRANGLPNHEVGQFPNEGNPNALRAQSHEVKLPLAPKVAEQPTVARPEFGIALNGVIFDAGTGEFWTPENDRSLTARSEWNYEALGGGVPLGIDQNNAHVQPTGKYHYHGVPTGLLDELQHDHEHASEHDHDHNGMIQLGWAFDGFPIYSNRGYKDPNDATSELVQLRSSYRLKAGERPEPPEGPGGEYDGTFGLDWEYVEGSGDLDECNGRFGVTPEFPEGTYYYVITEEFPSIPRFWKGTAEGRGARGGPNGRGGPGGQRPDAGDRRRQRQPGTERPANRTRRGN